MFNLQFETGNSAFEGEELRPEIVRILREIADAIEDNPGNDIGGIWDVNGNNVGKWQYRE